MGGVYAGTHIELSKKVAVKVLHPWLAEDMKSCQRFLQEARAICSLSHPNVVAVDRCGKDGNCIFIAMEYLEGESLAERIKKRGALGVDEAVYIVSEAAAGLQHAHSHGILHRDVKPSNIMLGTADSTSVHVVDFGIAKFNQPEAEQQQNLTSTNATIGTPYYMSPEQSSRQELDPRSDVYSLGCVLYEALTGKVPFEGENALSILLAHSQEQAPTLPKQIPMWLQTVVAKAMAKDREQRYQTMTDFRRALLEKEQAPHMVRRRKSRKRNTTIVIALACVAGALAAPLYMRHFEHRPVAPVDVSTESSRLDSVHRIGTAANKLRDLEKNADARTVYNQLRSYRGQHNGYAVERAVWAYMTPMIMNELVLKQHADARSDADYFLESTKLLDGPSSLYYARALAVSGTVEYFTDRFAEARSLFAKAVQIADSADAQKFDDIVLKEQVYEQVLPLYYMVDAKAAEGPVRKVLEYNLKNHMPPTSIAYAYYALASVYAQQQRWPEARSSMEKCDQYLPPEYRPSLAHVVWVATLGNLARASKAYEEAAWYYSEMARLAETLPPSPDRTTYLNSALAAKKAMLEKLGR
jgi:serine/threonine protein kinase